MHSPVVKNISMSNSICEGRKMHLLNRHALTAMRHVCRLPRSLSMGGVGRLGWLRAIQWWLVHQMSVWLMPSRGQFPLTVEKGLLFLWDDELYPWFLQLPSQSSYTLVLKNKIITVLYHQVCLHLYTITCRKPKPCFYLFGNSKCLSSSYLYHRPLNGWIPMKGSGHREHLRPQASSCN